ncbi:hypothetical protein KCU96_g57, partial [Aureobasidium melanogenum]
MSCQNFSANGETSMSSRGANLDSVTTSISRSNSYVGDLQASSVDGAAEAVSTPLSAGYAVVVVLNRRIASTARHVLQLLLSRPLLLVDLTKHLLKLTHLVTRSLAHGPWIAPTAEPIPPSNPPKASDDTPPTSVPVNAPSPAPTPVPTPPPANNP